MIALIDYGAGNLASVRRALAAIGASVWTPTVPGELGRAHGVVVPGVGHFDSTRGLDQAWRTAIRSEIDDGIPLLGICVGLQWLFEGSAEAPDVPGLGILKGVCFGFSAPPKPQAPGPKPQVPSPKPQAPSPKPLKVPHVGWNSLTLPRSTRLMNGIVDGTQVYFTHSFAAPVCDETAAVTEYGVPFSAAVERGNVSGVQFHPEKSGDAGLRILSNWFAEVKGR